VSLPGVGTVVLCWQSTADGLFGAPAIVLACGDNYTAAAKDYVGGGTLASDEVLLNLIDYGNWNGAVAATEGTSAGQFSILPMEAEDN
jgi:hypothetical protein